MPETVNTLRRLTARERRLIRGVLAAVVLLAVGVVVAVASTGPSSGNGCLHLTIPGQLARRRSTSAGAPPRTRAPAYGQPGTFSSLARQDVVAACRKAGLPLG